MKRIACCLLFAALINEGLSLFFINRLLSPTQSENSDQSMTSCRPTITDLCPALDCDNLDAPGQIHSPLTVNECYDRRKAKEDDVACEIFETALCEEDCVLGHKVDDNRCITSCECQDEITFEGDILLTKMNVAGMSSSIVNKAAARFMVKNRWDNRIEDGYYMVPFTIDYALRSNPAALLGICTAIEDFAKETCIRFVCASSPLEDHISIEAGDKGCQSHIGRIGGKQKISLGMSCHYKEIVIHEIMHSMGFWHEHTRPDRDNYVKIHTENITPLYQKNFNKRTIDDVDSMGSPYDLSSIMHYDGCNFAKDRFPTITTCDGARVRVEQPGLSREDMNQLNMMYKCKKTHSKSTYKGNCFCKPPK